MGWTKHICLGKESKKAPVTIAGAMAEKANLGSSRRRHRDLCNQNLATGTALPFSRYQGGQARASREDLVLS